MDYEKGAVEMYWYEKSHWQHYHWDYKNEQVGNKTQTKKTGGPWPERILALNSSTS